MRLLVYVYVVYVHVGPAKLECSYCKALYKKVGYVYSVSFVLASVECSTKPKQGSIVYINLNVPLVIGFYL